MDQAGLEQFIGQYGRDIYSFCCYLTRSRQEADDLYQDIFVKAIEAQVFPEDVEGAKNLLLSVAVNLWKNQSGIRHIAHSMYKEASRKNKNCFKFCFYPCLWSVQYA